MNLPCPLRRQGLLSPIRFILIRIPNPVARPGVLVSPDTAHTCVSWPRLTRLCLHSIPWPRTDCPSTDGASTHETSKIPGSPSFPSTSQQNSISIPSAAPTPAGESTEGTSPSAARRTGHEPLDSSGSHYPADGFKPRSFQCGNNPGSL